jgi:hypothetical protein
VRTHI